MNNPPDSRKERNFRTWRLFVKMPRLRNLPPYHSNDIVQWFARESGMDIPEAHKCWEQARDWSKHSKHPCLIFDRETREWHGLATD
jgi:hypothetical protein